MVECFDMRTEQLLLRLLPAVTLMVAALIFAPSGVQAHAGHSHAVRAATVTKPFVEPCTGTQVNDVAPISVQDQATFSGTTDASASLAGSHGPKTPQSCPGGCCHSAGTGCCAAWISAPPEIFAPVLSRSVLVLAVIGRAGVTPGALPEPPKSLV